MDKIKAVSEAYSMQPQYRYVTDDDARNFSPTDSDIMEIKLEQYSIGFELNIEWMYVGYGFDDKVKFRFLANACNVTYF